MPILEEQGYFWWQGEPISEDKVGPDSAVPGVLLIDSDGRITLEMNGILTTEGNPLDMLYRDAYAEIPKSIVGILKKSGDRVLLAGVRKNGGHASGNSISYQKFAAQNCLVGRELITENINESIFSEIVIPLDGFEEWLRIGSIRRKQRDNTIVAAYRKPDDADYQVEHGTISIRYHVAEQSSGMRRVAKIVIEESATACFRPTSPADLDLLGREYKSFNDLLLLLTESSLRLDWPRLVIPEKGTYRWYFYRSKNEAQSKAPRYYEMWTNFPILRSSFGTIYATWKRKQTEIGPSINLFVATKSGMSIYIEHKFISLVTGIESLHRNKKPANATKDHLERVDKILSEIQDEQDRAWVKRYLKYSYEPSLTERLAEILNELPLGLQKKRVQIFAQSCTERRNDLAHHGGPRNSKVTYEKFADDLIRKTYALSTLLHARLLQEIGVDETIFKSWIIDGGGSYGIRHNFVAAGLMKDETKKEKAAKATRINKAIAGELAKRGT